MKKNKFLTLQNVLLLLAVVLGVVSICMMFVNSVTLGAKSTTIDISSKPVSYTGVQATFGEEHIFAFSFMNLLTYILVLVAMVLSVVKMFGPLKSKVANYVITALFVVAGVFFFCSGAFSVLAETTDAVSGALSSAVTITKSITTGAIVAGCLSLTAGVLTLVPTFAKTKTKRK